MATPYLDLWHVCSKQGRSLSFGAFTLWSSFDKRNCCVAVRNGPLTLSLAFAGASCWTTRPRSAVAVGKSPEKAGAISRDKRSGQQWMRCITDLDNPLFENGYKIDLRSPVHCEWTRCLQRVGTGAGKTSLGGYLSGCSLLMRSGQAFSCCEQRKIGFWSAAAHVMRCRL